MGWNLLNQIARFHEVWALTQEDDRTTVEGSLEGEFSSNIHFQYVGLPSILRPLLRLQGGHQLYYYLWQIKAYFVAKKLHKLHSFDLFHHITYANDWGASFIGALLPVTYIRGPGGGAQRTPKKFLSQYSFKVRLWEHLRTVGQWLFRHDPFFILGQSRAKAILVCNPESLAALPERWRAKAHLFSVNGVSATDLALYSPAKPKEGAFRVLSASKLLRIKGHRLGVQAFAAFAKKHDDATFTIVGDGPDSQYLRDLAQESGIEDKITFEGWVPREEVLQSMVSSDVFLFCGLRDGGGEVVVEAMSTGKPVVCLDVGGPSIHVTDASGIKVEATSPESTVKELAAALERLYLDRKLLTSMGKVSHERAVQVYHWDRVGERLMEIYQQAPASENGH
ncbi:MAG: glycosyltransferase [Chloroflexi bacterium]|nr:glycosyltransferase [Chloroflexota bacterium]